MLSQTFRRQWLLYSIFFYFFLFTRCGVFLVLLYVCSEKKSEHTGKNSPEKLKKVMIAFIKIMDVAMESLLES